MATIFIDDYIDLDLDSGSVSRNFRNAVLARGDHRVHRFGFRCRRNGTPVNISDATVAGYFIRPDGNTVILTGGTAENLATIEIPEACCAYTGNFTLAIQLLSNDVKGAMRIVDGTIVDIAPGAYIDPGDTIPPLADIEAIIAQAEQAEETLAGMSVTASQVIGEKYKIVVTTS